MEPDQVRIVETPISTVIFLHDRVYKLKRQVRRDFVDLTEREAREAICRREVELNRRLAPDVYLGVLDVLDPRGEPCDHLVAMRRLPDERRLSALVHAGADVSVDVARIAHVLATFHAVADRSPLIDQAGRVEALRARWDHCFDTMEHHTGDVFESIDLADLRTMAHRYLDGRRMLFDARISDGWIRDGHGDLLAGDIFCLEDGPRILDCLEFDDHLRHGDVVADVAFLAMDLEHLGASEHALRLLALHRELLDDVHPASLTHHYVAHRAQVRSMVAALRASEGDEASRDEALDLAALARRHLEDARVRLVLVGGLPATGKTTVANAISDRLEWSALHADEVRKDLCGLPHQHHLGRGSTEPETGIYGAMHTKVTYEELLRRGGTLLRMGESVVLDASWTDASKRALARALARDTAADLVEIRCTASREITDDRLVRRLSSGTDASDATPDVARWLAARTHPWPEALTVDTSSGFGTFETVLAAITERKETA